MSENGSDELSALIELSIELNRADIVHLWNVLGLPQGLCQDASNVPQFLSSIKGWSEHDPFIFHQALQSVRPDLLAIACEIKWLCVSSPSEIEFERKELSIKTLIELLSTEIPKDKWILIHMVVANEAGDNVGFEITLKKMVENGFIKKDLKILSQILIKIQREDLVNKLKQYQNIFIGMEEGEFLSKFKREVGKQAKEMQQWEVKLKNFLQIQYGTIQQMLGEDASVDLAEVYIDLTILKQKPRAINFKDETTYNEIAYLRKIANKEVRISPVDFTDELIKYEATKPEIWCLIGNPGCGKTFLAKRTALRFGSSELVGIQYSISIPCRNTEWHSMESTRYEEGNKVESEFIQKWLCLGLPVGSNWSNDLAKHLAQSDGEWLLLIIDGLDEFTKKIPFKETFLYLLLTRQSLINSTIILTSRPGVWTDISSTHEMKINRYYQVLGFSPENRDLYFKKQITNESKLKNCYNLMERHDEMKQLSLIPVNASLFAALLKGEDSASINTLTKLYSELTLYMIRRELSRMGLQEFSRVARISDLHPDIQECFSRIGFIAFLGVANRDLMSEENVPLIMGQEEYPSHCLGLAHEHYKKEAVGLVKKVWSFAHLTMQEFTAAHWLSNNTWTQQCYSIRYISHSTDNFSLFKMLVRYLCGILSDKSAAILSIMYRYLTLETIKTIDLPLTLRFRTVVNKKTFIQVWKSFFELYLQLTAIFSETDSNFIANKFAHYRQFLPNPIYFYILQTVSPNEWICFLQSLQLLSQIQLICINTKYINPIQFIELIKKVKVCSVHYLVLKFTGEFPFELPSSEILAYTDTIKDAQLIDTKLCLHLEYCDLADDTAVNLFSQENSQIISSLLLDRNKYSKECLQQIANQLIALEYMGMGDMASDTIIPSLCQATQLKVLRLPYMPLQYYLLRVALCHFSNLQEIELIDLSLLPALVKLSNLTYLKIGDCESEESRHYPILLQLIFENRNTLRFLNLRSLTHILTDMDRLLECLALCSNLVELSLHSADQTTEDISLWSNLFGKMRRLVVLYINSFTIYDREFGFLCAGLAYHPTIREVYVIEADVTSLSCYPLIHLIPTVEQLEKLYVSDIDDPDEEAYKLLQQTADEHCIKLTL